MNVTKISAPKIQNALQRDRVFHILDCHRESPIVWFNAPAGSGKTTLVATWLKSRNLPFLWYQVDNRDGDPSAFFYYMELSIQSRCGEESEHLPLLTPEHMQTLPIFSRNYFDKLFQRMNQCNNSQPTKPNILVIDNYEELPAEAPLHAMLGEGLATVPNGIHVLILSRAAPPPEFIRHLANRQMQLVGWDDIRFTLDETRGLLLSNGLSDLPNDKVETLQSKSEGWVAGLILFMALGDDLSAALYPDTGNGVMKGFFDYFAYEIFNKKDPAIQEFLLFTALPDRIEPGIAARLTKNNMAGEILEGLARDQFFTRRHGDSYQYHNLFRQFLRDRLAAAYPRPELRQLRKRAADILLETSENEEAILLYIAAEAWDDAERLIIAEAPRFVAQGRIGSIAEWIRALPQEYTDQSPWAGYWIGVCRMSYNPIEARGHFEKALSLFRARGDTEGCFHAWSSIIETFVYAFGDFAPLDGWIAVGEELVRGGVGFQTDATRIKFEVGMLNALVWRNPRHPDLPGWAEKVLRTALGTGDISMRIALGSYLMIYYLYVGDFSKAVILMDGLRAFADRKENNAITLLNWHVMQAMYAWFVADKVACKEAIQQGLRIADESGVHLLDLYLLGQGMYCGLSLDDGTFAVACLEKMAAIDSPRPIDRSFYHHAASSVAWFQGDMRRAIEHGRICIQIAREAGSPKAHAMGLAELAVTLYDHGEREEAHRKLSQAADVARGCLGFQFLIHLREADFALREEEKGQAIESLRKAFLLAANHGYLNAPRWKAATMSRLCGVALEAGIEIETVYRLIRKRRLRAPIGSTCPDNWPWPLRIKTMGCFEILKDGRAIRPLGKVPRKPLRLLKALIAYGGKEVPESRIIDALWPEMTGENARNSYEMALSRLRKLIGITDFIERVDGRLSLDLGCCCVDFFDCRTQLERAQELWRKDPRADGEAIGLTQRIFTEYAEEFLPEEEEPWAITVREELKTRNVRLALLAASRLERANDFESALHFLEWVHRYDNLSEEPIQRLMTLYRKLGRKVDAVRSYQHWSKGLSSLLGIAPGAKSEEIYLSIFRE